jgi:hypothetical protein
LDRRVEAFLDARELQDLGRLPFGSRTSVSVHVMLAMRTDVVVQAHRHEPAAFETRNTTAYATSVRRSVSSRTRLSASRTPGIGRTCSRILAATR